jgi:hypothetical protein
VTYEEVTTVHIDRHREGSKINPRTHGAAGTNRRSGITIVNTSDYMSRLFHMSIFAIIRSQNGMRRRNLSVFTTYVWVSFS